MGLNFHMHLSQVFCVLFTAVSVITCKTPRLFYGILFFGLSVPWRQLFLQIYWLVAVTRKIRTFELELIKDNQQKRNV